MEEDAPLVLWVCAYAHRALVYGHDQGPTVEGLSLGLFGVLDHNCSDGFTGREGLP